MGDWFLSISKDNYNFTDEEVSSINTKDSMFNVSNAAIEFNKNLTTGLGDSTLNKNLIDDINISDPSIPNIDYSQVKPRRIIPFGYGSREDYPDHNILVSKPERFMSDAFDRRSEQSMFFGEEGRQPNAIKSLSKLFFYPRETFEDMGIKGRQAARGEDMSKYGVYASIRPQSPLSVVPPHGENNPEYYDRVLRQFERQYNREDAYKGTEKYTTKPAPMGLQMADETRSEQEIIDNKNHNSRYKNYLINQLEYLLEVMPKDKSLDSKRKNIKEVLKNKPKQGYIYHDELSNKNYTFSPEETTEPVQAMGNPYRFSQYGTIDQRPTFVWENNFHTFADPDEVDSYNEAIEAITEYKKTKGRGYDNVDDTFPDNEYME